MTPPTPNPSAGGAGDQPAPTQTSPRAAGGWWARYGKWLAYIAATAAAAAVGALTGRQVLPPPLPVLKTVEADDPPAAYGQGWVCDPDEVAVVADRMRGPRLFADTPAGRTGQDLPPAVYGWKAYEALFARPPPVKNQGQVGSCVSFGTNSAVERTLAAEIGRRGGTAGEWTRFAEEATYGGSRVEIGGGRIRGDGSIGVWAADFVTKYGCVPRAVYPTADLTVYSEPRCRQWGDRGVPTEFETEARRYPVKAYSQVKSWADAKKAMAQGYFIAVCSNQGFSMRRDANGVCRPQGAWAHCMALDGYHTEGGKEYGHIVNSWGPEAHTGPVGWGDPGPDGFWAEAAVVDRMLRAGDSWAFSGVTGFPARKPLDWFVVAPACPHDRRQFAPPLFALAP